MTFKISMRKECWLCHTRSLQQMSLLSKGFERFKGPDSNVSIVSVFRKASICPSLLENLYDLYVLHVNLNDCFTKINVMLSCTWETMLMLCFYHRNEVICEFCCRRQSARSLVGEWNSVREWDFRTTAWLSLRNLRFDCSFCKFNMDYRSRIIFPK